MVPNKPNMTTIICRKLPRMGAHWKPRKSKICLSNAESCNKAKTVHEYITCAPSDHVNVGFTVGEGIKVNSIALTDTVITKIVTPISCTALFNVSQKIH